MHERIVADPRVMVGKPVIRGTRVPVETVLSHLMASLDMGDLFEAYPHLTAEDVRACLSYARDLVRADYVHQTHEPAVAAISAG